MKLIMSLKDLKKNDLVTVCYGDGSTLVLRLVEHTQGILRLSMPNLTEYIASESKFKYAFRNEYDPGVYVDCNGDAWLVSNDGKAAPISLKEDGVDLGNVMDQLNDPMPELPEDLAPYRKVA